MLAKNLIVQIGTQHRSEPYQSCRARSDRHSGALGEVTKYEIAWNYHGPRWRGRHEVKEIREQDTDWRAWLMNKPQRPFDPQLYFEFRLYKDFSSGIADQWMSHGIDLVHYFMDDKYPESVVANGGIFAWHDGRENPDTFQALLTYPKGFLVSYSTSFGNDAPGYTRIMGKNATLMQYRRRREAHAVRWWRKRQPRGRPDMEEKRKSEGHICCPGKTKLAAHGDWTKICRWAHDELV